MSVSKFKVYFKYTTTKFIWKYSKHSLYKIFCQRKMGIYLKIGEFYQYEKLTTG